MFSCLRVFLTGDCHFDSLRVQFRTMFVEPGLPMPITVKTYEDLTGKILRIVRYQESGTVIFCPKSDRLRRINQILADKEILKKNLPRFAKTKFILLNPDVVSFDDEEELKDFILETVGESITGDLKTVVRKLSERFDLVFFVINAETLFLERKKDYLAVLALLQVFNPTISVILFCEVDVCHPDFINLLDRYTVFCQNSVLAPLYGKADADCFFDYLSEKWGMTVELSKRKSIFDNCRFYWLIKEAVRFLRDDPKADLEQIFSAETMQLKVKIVYESFLESEKSVLKAIAANQSIIDPKAVHSWKFLLKMGVIEEDKGKSRIAVPILQAYIESCLRENRILVGKGREIFVNGLDISRFFSKKEQKALTLLITKEGCLVNRDEMAKGIWGQEYLDYYSDWSLDQTISRLRKKLAKIGLVPKKLRTIKKQGYIFGKEEK